MGMGEIATTGMQAAMSSMQIISNNIANSNTWGFKSSSANFSEIFPSGNGAAGANAQIGLGVNLSRVEQNFKPGSPANASNAQSNMSIDGDGFFVVKDVSSSQTHYTRNGQFLFDSNGYFVLDNQRLQGFPAVNGVIPSGGTPVDLKVSMDPVTAKASTTVTQLGLTLNSGDTNVPSATFNPNTLSTFNYQTNAKVLDSLGNSHNLTLYYIKNSATGNSWTVNALADGTQVGTGTLTFDGTGAFVSSTLNSITFAPGTGADTPQDVAIALDGATQTSGSYAASPFTVDGYPAGSFQTYSVDSNGLVYGIFSNGPAVLAGQVAVGKFQNPQGLQSVGNSAWVASTTSGAPTISPDNSQGHIRPQTLETSNVALADELVNLINAQNAFQANAQVEQTYNQVMQTVTKF